jgi:hypothetical protein
MEHNVYVESEHRPSARTRRISWGAIFAGLFVTAAIQVLLTLLGASIGAATIDPLQERDPTRGLATGSAIWIVASALISVWLGACVAGRLSGGPRRADGMLHGVVTWSVSTLVMLGLLTTAAGALLGGTATLLSSAMGPQQPGQSGAQAMVQELQRMMPQTQNGVLAPTGRTSSSPEARAQTAQVADTAARGVSKGAMWAFIGMLLGLLTAAWGGWVGTSSLPRYNELEPRAVAST